MDIREAIRRVTELKHLKKLLDVVVEYVEEFEQVEDEPNTHKVIWMEEGGSVSQEVILSFLQQLKTQRDETINDLEYLLGVDVDERTEEEAL